MRCKEKVVTFVFQQENKPNGTKEENSENKKDEGSKPKKKKHAVKTNDLPIESVVPSLDKKHLNLAVEKEVRLLALLFFYVLSFINPVLYLIIMFT